MIVGAFFSPIDPGGPDLLAGLSLTNCVGYIPVIGAIVGIARIIFACREIREHTIKSLGLIVRGVTECVGIGSLWLLPDVLTTISGLGYFAIGSVRSISRL